MLVVTTFRWSKKPLPRDPERPAARRTLRLNQGPSSKTQLRLDRLRAWQGRLTLEEMADELGATINAVAKLCRRYSIPFTPDILYTEAQLTGLKREDLADQARRREIELAKLEAPRVKPYKKGLLEW